MRKGRIWRMAAGVMTCGMIISASPQLTLQAEENMKEMMEQTWEINADDMPIVEAMAAGTGEEAEEIAESPKLLQAVRALELLAEERAILATIYHTDSCVLASEAGYAGGGIVELPSGTQVMIESVAVQDGSVWYLVSCAREERSYNGYVSEDYLISIDERFLDWQQEYLRGVLTDIGVDVQEDTLAVKAADEIQAFPESYRPYLYQLKSAHPNWVFVPMNTRLEWDDVIKAEMSGDRSWVHSSKSDAWKGEQRDTNWYLATREAVEYCIDPRNFLNERYLFMFEQLTYNSSHHSLQGVRNIVQSTFMSGEIPGEGISYVQYFYNLGQGLGVSPYHLASRVWQEQGVNGTSPLISGVYPGYEGYYNYYNIGASGNSNTQVIESGLKYARSKGWNSRTKSIKGGAEFLSKNYILRGQDTLYLQKFDVDASYNGLFSHQYMQNITAPMTEGYTTRNAYEKANALGNSFVFKIPVYRNMPVAPCPEPGTSQGANPTEEQLKNFITRLYVNALGRADYAEEEVTYWYQKMVSGECSGAEAAQGFFFSDEFRNKKLGNEEYLNTLYQVMFDRTADEEGWNNWLGKLEAGMSREYVYAGFANSAEFNKLCGEYGVRQGRITCNAYRDQSEGVTAFVNRLYRKALGRDGDDAGMEDWCRRILRREQDMETVAYGFIFSDEFRNHNLPDEEYVRTLYQTFLDRECDTAGFNDWMEKLSGGMTREAVFYGFARSREFRELMAEYGIRP